MSEETEYSKIPRYSRKSILCKKKVTIEINDDDSDVSKEMRYDIPSEDDIKLNWKTLMKYNKNTWDIKSKPPVPKEEIDDDDRDIFFIGMSEIKGKKITLLFLKISYP